MAARSLCCFCANCNNAAAAGRAEKLRQLFSELPQRDMASICITASFGVTEIQPGDTPETMLRRGRPGAAAGQGHGPQQGRAAWRRPGRAATRAPQDPLVAMAVCRLSAGAEEHLADTVPLRVAIEKLRGFIADNHAQIVSLVGNDLVLEINEANKDRHRRTTDRAVPMLVELSLVEEALSVNRPGGRRSCAARTRIEVAIRPKRVRDRRHECDAGAGPPPFDELAGVPDGIRVRPGQRRVGQRHEINPAVAPLAIQVKYSARLPVEHPVFLPRGLIASQNGSATSTMIGRIGATISGVELRLLNQLREANTAATRMHCAWRAERKSMFPPTTRPGLSICRNCKANARPLPAR